jgi:hypothetical protein
MGWEVWKLVLKPRNRVPRSTLATSAAPTAGSAVRLSVCTPPPLGTTRTLKGRQELMALKGGRSGVNVAGRPAIGRAQTGAAR